ncbi:type II toxin-antitoxin system RelE/ParE family toxin [Rubritalea profundi]|uniref:Plasmid stabilization protein n=1 Tax=Rubritalea profundi TaxID=1658618 RepID=A0A2S7TZ46_9BACT|nr:type II toxin-antitoxin system RelE/ParE family toxin [Rubritalea profundi]PQJ27332.1 hypothetical protein BSZ32_01700 [Rubritalea profundi]
MQPSWHEEATGEFCLSAVYYESKTEGLGERFIMEVGATVARILYDPESIRVFGHGCRKMNLRRFPYSVIYTVREDRVHVVAVMAHSRKPGYWIKRS